MRSWLFVPGDSERKILKSLSSKSDVVILDLEDSVSPANKKTARSLVSGILANRPETTAQIYVRVNAFDSNLMPQDLAALSETMPDGYMLPKSASGSDVVRFASLTPPNLPIIAITTETANSLFNLGSYGDIEAPLAAMTWGSEDLSCELGAVSARNELGHLTDPYRLARSLCLIGARSANVEPIDSIYANFRDLAGLEQECRSAVRDGFIGKMAIHPDQIAIINQQFTPPKDLVDQAQQLVAAFARTPDVGVIAIDGQMYDLPHLRRAKKLIIRARLYKS